MISTEPGSFQIFTLYLFKFSVFLPFWCPVSNESGLIWLQVQFVWYHYFDAQEVFNSIRCYIGAYVWMTGFGMHGNARFLS